MNYYVMAICETIADLQSLLHDHVECGKYTAAEVVAKVYLILEDGKLLQAMHDVGYIAEPLPTLEELD